MMMILRTVLILATHAATASTSSDAQAAPPTTAIIDSGVIVGAAVVEPRSQATVVQYLGVPFAAPPERFRPPRQPEPWCSPYDASTYKPACMQKFGYPPERRQRLMAWYNTPPSVAGESEDCLNLNVFVPVSRSRRPKPVLFWLFGGAFDFGTGSLPMYDGTSFAANQDVIVVTSNYRTNVFGFPGSPELNLTEQNLGWFDQRLALSWVQRNIAALGGDPNKVTLVGESAGAGGVDALVTSPPYPRPFRAAIMQSGQASIITPNNDSAESWKKLTRLANCTDGQALRCLGALPATELKSLVERENLHFAPVPDGGVTWAYTPRIDRRRSRAWKSSIARVPVMIGSNADEGMTFVYPHNDTREYIQKTWPALKQQIIDLATHFYPVGQPRIPTILHQLNLITTEVTMQCPARALAADNHNVGIQTWRYYFNASFANTQIFQDSGAWHSSEIGLIFGTYPKEGATPFQAQLSSRMQTAWADFIKNPYEGPGWAPSPQMALIGMTNDSLNGGAGPGAADPIVSVNPAWLDLRCLLLDGLFNKLTLGHS
ncbi:hypothetical protein E4U42_007443 [Claviceps africana]|uniref:Carboxylesterase type B domain-containing protein n=1 Tax=Claviceps africana TaxID=83212 RepID=A0A8K0JBC7_9HYPO|nr:hypothetical protein E4U42_007443 [Claviceps africana]